MAELGWVRFYGDVVDVGAQPTPRVVLKAISPRVGCISLDISDIYVNNQGLVFVKRSAQLRRVKKEDVRC